MALTSMKLSTAESKTEGNFAMADKPQYPYGLCIELDKIALEKLGIKDLPDVGTEATVTAKVMVRSVSASQYEGGNDSASISLQITDMDTDLTGDESIANTLYNKTKA